LVLYNTMGLKKIFWAKEAGDNLWAYGSVHLEGEPYKSTDWARFYFPKVQSGKQINKKHFQNNSNEIDLWFMCRIELQALAWIWNSMDS